MTSIKEFLDLDTKLIRTLEFNNEPEQLMKRAKEIEDLVERMKRTEEAEKERRHL